MVLFLECYLAMSGVATAAFLVWGAARKRRTAAERAAAAAYAYYARGVI